MENEKHLLLMDAALTEIETKVDTLSTKLDKVYDVIVGNEFGKDNSIIARLKNLENDIKILQDFRSRSIWTISICSTLAALIGYILHIIIK
ncbi:MAG: hypothetical protein ABI921_12480 [Panacibacter sp.]